MIQNNVIVINPNKDIDKIKALASEQRIQLLNLLRMQSMNINDIAKTCSLPQSNIATNIKILEEAGLVNSERVNAKRGSQKLCSIAFSEIVIKDLGKIYYFFD